MPRTRTRDPLAPATASPSPTRLSSGHLAVLLGTLAIALGAQLSTTLPGAEVPQSAQTLAVLLAGTVLGPRRGLLSVLLYIGVGAIGLPVFADGGAGISTVTGPSAGYLFGFAIATPLTGLWVRKGLSKSIVLSLVGMVLAHAVILGLGWIRLAAILGGDRAYVAGVEPFLVGGIIKSLVAACIATLLAYRGAATLLETKPPGAETEV